MFLEAGFLELLYAELFSYILLQFVKVKLWPVPPFWVIGETCVVSNRLLHWNSSSLCYYYHSAEPHHYLGLICVVTIYCLLRYTPGADTPRPWRRYNFTWLLLLTASLWLKEGWQPKMPNRKNHQQPSQSEDLQTLICIHLLHQIHKLKASSPVPTGAVWY